MKLLRSAKAALTLGPCMPRDNLMQAAGRLRQLDKEQKLVLLGTDEICRLVAGCCDVPECDVGVAHVLEWVHHNTAMQNSEVRTVVMKVWLVVDSGCFALPSPVQFGLLASTLK